MIKIISGKYKGRIIPTVKNAKYRPSTTRLKEAIFSILDSGDIGEYFSLQNAHVLDLFAGTGSLAFEALSRGAKTITLVEVNNSYLQAARIFAKNLSQEEFCHFLNFDVLRLSQANKKFDLIFMDPPYYTNLVHKSLEVLVQKNWLQKDSLVVIEIPRKEDLNIDNTKFIEIINRKYGNNKLVILKTL